MDFTLIKQNNLACIRYLDLLYMQCHKIINMIICVDRSWSGFEINPQDVKILMFCTKYEVRAVEHNSITK